jgi:uncharacterized membrane protein YjdF
MKQNGKKRSISWKKLIGILLFLSLLFSIGYAVACMIRSPSVAPPGDPHAKVKSDYTLMLVQCMTAILVMFLPSALERRFRLEIPNYMVVLYFAFLYRAVYLGEVRNFYYAVPHWDTILHGFSGAMLGALGFVLVNLLNDAPNVKMSLSPGFVAFFAFCFALACGAVWEIYEYLMDGLLHMNMQHFAIEDGTPLMGRAALLDTMKDLIVDALGALVIAVIGYFPLRWPKDRT